jgi:hypothetical protein
MSLFKNINPPEIWKISDLWDDLDMHIDGIVSGQVSNVECSHMNIFDRRNIRGKIFQKLINTYEKINTSK